MKFLLPAAVSALALVAPAFAAELQERAPHHQQHNSGNTVTVHDTVHQTHFATQYVTVTLGADQAQCTQAAESVDTTTTTAAALNTGSSNSHQNQYQYQQQGNNNNNNNRHTEQAQAATTTAAPVMETITSTRTYTTAVMHPTTVEVTTTVQGQMVVHTVTKTITEHVRQTEVVTKTRTKFVHETEHVTETDTVRETQGSDSTTTANVAENTSTSVGGSIADVNTNVVTVTDVETSTFLITTTVDGSAAVETGTTTITSAASTSTDVGGNIADVTTTSSAAGSDSTDDPQTSFTLDPRVIEHGFEQDGQGTPTPGQVSSLTSGNNFINFCLTQNVPLTDGKQIRTGSCNVVPQGFIIAKDRLPSAKFVFPENFSTIPANQPFTAKLRIKNLQAGAFTNANLNYYAAPAQVNDQGIVIGHSHLVVEPINGLDDIEPADPTKFAFFKGLNKALDQDGIVSADLTAGLPAGTYRMFSINTAANHQPVLASVAQHGSMDDGVYFTVA